MNIKHKFAELITRFAQVFEESIIKAFNVVPEVRPVMSFLLQDKNGHLWMEVVPLPTQLYKSGRSKELIGTYIVPYLITTLSAEGITIVAMISVSKAWMRELSTEDKNITMKEAWEKAKNINPTECLVFNIDTDSQAFNRVFHLVRTGARPELVFFDEGESTDQKETGRLQNLLIKQAKPEPHGHH